MADLIARRRPDTRRQVVRHRPITASAAVVVPSRNLRIVRHPWQQELWDFYRERVGAFKYAMLWHTQTMSRVRLVAAIQRPDAEEPEIVTEGPAAEAMRVFYGGRSGQSQYMASMDLQLQVPGEGWVVGEATNDGYDWCVKSTQEIDVASGRGRNGPVNLWKIQVDEGVWKTLPEDSYVFRQWIADGQFAWRPDSPARGALPVLRLIDMLERRLMSQAVSRLAMNGFLKYAEQITFPANPKYKDEPDPFIAELLDIASRVISDPGSALAAMPLPIKIPAEYFDKFEHVPFANPYDEKTMEIINGLYDKLSVAMNMPKEVVTGMGDTSHWNAWSLDEQGIETHIKPVAEAICQGLTKAYLKPWLAAAGEPWRTSDGDLIVWYDTDELDTAPDLGAAATDAVEHIAISPAAYRNAKGFGEDAAPSKQEIRDMLLIVAAKNDPSLTQSVIKELTGLDVELKSSNPPPTLPSVEPSVTDGAPTPNGPPPQPEASPGQPTSQPSVPAGG